MLYNSSISIALKNEVGNYVVKEMTLFEINNINKYFTNLQIKFSNNKDVMIKMKCPFCERYHSYKYSLNEILCRDMLICGCENIGSPIFIIGNPSKVLDRVNKFSQINKSIYAV